MNKQLKEMSLIATHSNFLIPLFFKSDDVNLWYFKLRLSDITEIIVWNIWGIRPWVAKILGLEIRVCGKDLIPLSTNEPIN